MKVISSQHVCDAGDTCLFPHFSQTFLGSLKLVLFTRYTDHLIGMHFSILPLPHLSHQNLEAVKKILSVEHVCNFSDLVFLLQSFQYQVLWHCHRVFWSQTFWPNLKIIKYCKISFYVSCIYAKPSYAWVFLTHFSLTAYKWASEVSEIARTWKQMSIDRGMDKEDVAHIYYGLFSSVQFSHSVVSDSLRLHESQHIRPPCPSQWWWTSSRWCHPAISSSVVPSSSCPQSLQASGSFPVSQLFSWGGQSIGVSASVSVLPMNNQDWSPSGWTGWISLQSKGLLRVFSNTTVQKHQFFSTKFSSQSNSYIHTWPLEKP